MCLLRRKRFFIAWLILLLAVQSAQAQKVRYFYDDLGRLIGVVDQEGNAARYVYDEVGNVLEVRRTNIADFTGPVAITFFDPDQGQVGTQVTIFGAGFSDTPGENTIAFNGVSAPVLAASTNSLTTQVPDGATTGPISVTTPLGSATSQENFTVAQTFAVVPDQADVVLGGTLGFQATLDGNATSAVTWRVNGVESGNAELGTITSEGIYIAPSSPPPVQPVHIEAVLTADPTQIARAAAHVVGEIAGLIAASPVTVRSAASSEGLATAVPLIVGVVQVDVAQAVSTPITVGVAQGAGAQAVSRPVTVAVTSAQGSQAVSEPLSVAGGPVVTSVNPPDAAQGTIDLAITVTGANLSGASKIQWLRNGLGESSLTASSITSNPEGTSVNFNLSISTTAFPGPRVLRVVTPQGTSTSLDIGTNFFTVTGP